MAEEKRPKTSSTETALDLAGAALDLVDAATSYTEHPRLSRRGALNRLVTVMNGAKDLRGYQLDDVAMFVSGRILADETEEGQPGELEQALQREPTS